MTSTSMKSSHRGSSARSSTAYASNIHHGYRRLHRSSIEDEKFCISPAIVYPGDLYKPKLLTDLIREEKIKSINARVTRPTATTLKSPKYSTQEQLLTNHHRNIQRLMLDNNGGLKRECFKDVPLTSIDVRRLSPSTGCLRTVYHTLWSHPTKDSYQLKWRSNSRLLTSDFKPQSGSIAKSFSLYKKPPRQ